MTSHRSIVTGQEIQRAVGALGIHPGATLLVHSSLSSLGWVDGGAETVIAALTAAISPSGTLVMPTLCQKARERRFETWDVDTSRSDVGHITEVFRKSKGVLRSNHATHSVAARGPLAARICAGHAGAHGRPGPWGPAAFGVGSPWEELYTCEATLLFLGVDFTVNTTGHFVEHLVAEETLKQWPAAVRRKKLTELRAWEHDGVWPSFDRLKLQSYMQEEGLLRSVQCGEARLLSCSYRAVVDTGLHLIKADPRAWLKASFLVWLTER